MNNDPDYPDADSCSLPPNEREQWMQRNIAKLRGALSEPQTRRQLYALLAGEELREDD